MEVGEEAAPSEWNFGRQRRAELIYEKGIHPRRWLGLGPGSLAPEQPHLADGGRIKSNPIWVTFSLFQGCASKC